MNDAFDAVDFALYLRSRWRFVAICCVTALALAYVTGMMLPKRYTAHATLIIEPPAGADPRGALAVSPVYLESLKTYEDFATSDTLFARALDELGLRQRYPNSSIESLKHRVLSVTKPATTRLIEIEATLDSPIGAKRLAQFIAEQTVALNRSMDQHSSEDAIRDAQNNVTAAEARLNSALKASTRGNGPDTVDSLTTGLEDASDLKYDIERDLARAHTDLADLTSQHFSAGDEKAAWNAQEIAATRARIQDLEAQEKKLEATVSAKAAILERIRPGRDALDAEERLARTDLETARTKLNELRASSAFRSERLEVLDPGVVPERPSYPNTPLMLLVALAVSAMASLGYLAAAFGYSRAMSERAERVYNMR